MSTQLDGVPLRGPWDEATARGFLAEASLPVRLAVLGRSGHPLIASLWYLHRDGALWCAVQQEAAIAQALERDPRCAFEIAPDRPPYHGLRGQGEAVWVPDQAESVLRALIDRYLGDARSDLARWLLGRIANETALRISPRRWSSWDYRSRMGDSRASP